MVVFREVLADEELLNLPGRKEWIVHFICVLLALHVAILDLESSVP
jgi:hypothetical protein